MHTVFPYSAASLFHQKVFHFCNIYRHSDLTRDLKNPLPQTHLPILFCLYESQYCAVPEAQILNPACPAQIIASYVTMSKLFEPHCTFVM